MISDRNPIDDVPRNFLLPPVVKPGRSRFRIASKILNIFEWHTFVKRSVIAVTRKLCGDSRDGSPASFSRRLTSSQIAFVVRALLGLPSSKHLKGNALW